MQSKKETSIASHESGTYAKFTDKETTPSR